MTRNKELFYRIADQVERHPETYDQSVYGEVTPCGTSHCIAGHAAAMSGCRPTVFLDGSLLPNGCVVTDAAGKKRDVDLVAAELLGIEHGEASWLFSPAWEPPPEMTVPEALRRLGDGAPINEVTESGLLGAEDDDDEEHA